MQNYYRLLGIGPTATAPEIVAGYLQQRARLKRLAAHDPAMHSRLAEVEAGYAILGHPRRRLAYDVLLAQEPAPPPAAPTRYAADARMASYAQWARRLNPALLAACLLLLLDWALPPTRYPHETVTSRYPIAVSTVLSDPKMAYRVRTQHTAFRLPGAIGYRVRQGQRLVVWQTPLLRQVQRVSVVDAGADATPFQPYGGTIYGVFFLLPLLMGAVAAAGMWPGCPAETVVSTATVSSLLALLVLVILLRF